MDDAGRSHEVGTTCVSKWDQVPTQAGSLAHPLTRMVLTNAALLRQQIFETQLRIISLQVMRTGNARHIQRFTHCVEMKTNDARR